VLYYSYNYQHIKKAAMKTIQMTLDDDLVKSVDITAKKLHMNRSAFTRIALREALKKISATNLEQKHANGYKTHPVTPHEFSVWENEQAWGDA
jgi:metal-responsive CopG/Arc/MetJ family transcriptional regulator